MACLLRIVPSIIEIIEKRLAPWMSTWIDQMGWQDFTCTLFDIVRFYLHCAMEGQPIDPLLGLNTKPQNFRSWSGIFGGSSGTRKFVDIFDHPRYWFQGCFRAGTCSGRPNFLRKRSGSAAAFVVSQAMWTRLNKTRSILVASAILVVVWHHWHHPQKQNLLG